MTFVNLSLLTLGGLFVAVPILLHLAMRQRPKEQIFPALRFLKQRQETNQRRLRLRQALLLLLRCLIVLLLALALARPSVSSAQLGHWLVTGSMALLLLMALMFLFFAVAYRRGWALIAFLSVLCTTLAVGLVGSSMAMAKNKSPALLGQQRAAVAAVILIDSSPRMLLRYQNQSRLERAQVIGKWLLGNLPRDSEVAVVDRLPANFSADVGAAEAVVDALEVSYVLPTWQRRVEESIELLQQSKLPRKELYLITDLTRQTWKPDAANPSISARLADTPNVTLQVIDVGVEQPKNVAIADLELSQSSLTPGSPLTVRARLAKQTGSGEVTAQLSLENQTTGLPFVVDGQLQQPSSTVRGRNSITLTADQDRWVTFPIASLDYGTHFGHVALESSDALTVDDRRDFAVYVRPPWPILVVQGEGSNPYLITERIAPLEFREAKRSRFECRVVDEKEFTETELEGFSAIAFLDPRPFSNGDCQRVQRYVERGGGVLMMLGRNVGQASQFNTSAIMELMPAPLKRIWVDKSGLAVAPRDYHHPTVRVMRDYAATLPWDSMPVFRHWVVGELQDQAGVVLEFSNNKPFLLERQLGAGRVFVMTTPGSDPDSRGRSPWNLLSTGIDSWPFMILMDQTFQYLVQTSGARLNYVVGQSAQLPTDLPQGERLTVLSPAGAFQELSVDGGQARIPFTEVPGVFRMRIEDDAVGASGFAVNLSQDVTRLDRLKVDELDDLLGKDRYRLAVNEKEIVREIDEARIGREFYPFLLPLLACILAMEYVIANRFYPKPKSQPVESLAA